MTDEIYDYFGGNAPKKVEPIEDDDIAATNESVAEERPDEQLSQEAPNTEVPTADDPVAQVPVSEQPIFEETVNQPLGEEKAELDSWGSLLGELGIEDTTPPKKSTSVEASKTEDIPKSAGLSDRESDDSVISLELAENTSDEKPVDFLGLEPIPSPEDDTVLPEMFAPSGDPEFDEISSDVSSEKDDFLEFEIEELDDSPYRDGEEATHGRRSRRRPQSDDQETESRRTGRRRSRNRDDDAHIDRRKSQSTRDDSDREPVEFAAGLDLDADTAAEVDKPRRSRRRSRGRGRGRDRDRARDGQSDSETVEPSEVVDEIGWVVPVSSKTSEKAISDATDVDDELVGYSEEKESDSADRTRTRRRRRRGGKTRDKRRNDRESDADSKYDDSATDLDVVELDDPMETDSDDRGIEPSRSKGRRSSGRSRRTKDEDGESKGASKRPRFPTWEEAISGMIESNIKNHSRSSGRGGGGRGRNRGRSSGRSAR